MIDTHKLLMIGLVMADSGATREQIIEAVEMAKGPHPQRELTEDEYNIFSGAVGRAVDLMPAFRDAIALIRPFRDYTTATIYTDRHSRVGIGSAFFLPTVSPHKRASKLLHEAMHVLNNHFTRYVSFPIDSEDDNSAKDLEINSLLTRHPRVDLSDGLHPSEEPYRFPEAKSYEQYAALMRDKGLLKKTQNPQSPPQKQEQQDGEAQPGDPGSDAPSANGEPGEADPESGSTPGSESEEKSKEKQEGNGTKEDSESEGDSEDSDGDSSDGDPTGEESGGEGDGSAEGDSDPNSSDGGSESASDDPESIADDALEGTEGSDGKSGSGSKSSPESCDHSTTEREKIADDLKIERASSTEQAVARNNTMARVREEAAKSRERGDKAALRMLQQMELAMEPSKVDWRIIFRNIMSQSRDAISLGRTDHTYRRVNRRLSSGEFVFPGMIRYEPSSIMAIDTSGSMSKSDFVYLLSELENIVKSALRAKDRFKAFCVDGAATEPKTVRAIKDLDLRGGGGTMMEVAIKSIELLPKRDIPDIFILATDGGTSWPAFKRELLKSKYSYKTVVLITQESSYEVAKETLKGLADVIDISEEGTGKAGY